LACVLVFCCAPLFNRLGGLEQRNDEAIYSYSVDRILETGHWLTPRNIPDDSPFLEKPPLKFWMVAGLMKIGVIPQDDWGMRLPDAVLCTLAFVYIYLLGARLANPVAGFVSVLLLFAFEPLIFFHGIRGNNMEGALLLAYCGGVYHFFSWAAGSGDGRRRHAWLVGGYFFLAFMTKFVAAIFLPVVCVAAMAARPSAWADWRPRWRDWLRPAAVTAALIAPWFIYQTIRDAHWFWHVILMDHVVTRFTGVLKVSHLHPWHHYFTSLWDELQRAGSLPIVLLGIVALVWAAFAWPLTRRHVSASLAETEPRPSPASIIIDDRVFLARLLLLWWLLPETIISFGTSKLFYYSYPFLPPLAIAGGLVSSQLLNLFVTAALGILGRLRLSGFLAERAAGWQRRRLSYVLTVVGTLGFVVAAATAYASPMEWRIGGARLFKNSSVWKPFLAAVGSWYFAGLGAGVVRLIGVILVGCLMPLSAYEAQLRRLDAIDHPIRSARDCALAVQASQNLGHSGIYKMSGDTDHPYFYYLRRLGPYLFPDQAGPGELARRLEVDGAQTLVVLSAEDYIYLGGMLALPPPVVNVDSGLVPGVSEAAKSARLTHGLPPAVAISDSVVILFPGPYASCARVTAHAGPRAKKLVTFGGG
jgi:4-amino-4-deoxy-L-arabinose transferase-like glycosyltransferase